VVAGVKEDRRAGSGDYNLVKSQSPKTQARPIEIVGISKSHCNWPLINPLLSIQRSTVSQTKLIESVQIYLLLVSAKASQAAAAYDMPLWDFSEVLCEKKVGTWRWRNMAGMPRGRGRHGV
jgi:hypothetical protein